MANILQAKDFNIEKLKCGSLRVNDNQGKSVWISYENSKLVLQTPEMLAPFGISKWDKEKGGQKSELTLSFQGKEGRPALQKFYENLKEIDDKMISEALTNAGAWLKQPNATEPVLRALYTPIVRQAKDKNGDVTAKWADNFKASLPEKDGKYDFNAYLQNKELVDLNKVDLKGARVTAIVQCLGIWIAGGKFGVSWKVLQLLVTPQKKLDGFCFREVEDRVADEDLDKEEDDEALDHAVVKSDDDDVVESDDELEIKKTEPVKIKKTVVRKK